MKKNKFAYFLLIIGCLFLPLSFVAAQTEQHQLVPEKGYENGDYNIQSFEEMAIFVGKAILGLSGTFALAMFVWGGVQMIIAAGNSEAFKKGKTTVVNALIGLAVILCSYLIIDFVLNLVGAQSWTRTEINNVINK